MKDIGFILRLRGALVRPTEEQSGNLNTYLIL